MSNSLSNLKLFVLLLIVKTQLDISLCLFGELGKDLIWHSLNAILIV